MNDNSSFEFLPADVAESLAALGILCAEEMYGLDIEEGPDSLIHRLADEHGIELKNVFPDGSVMSVLTTPDPSKDYVQMFPPIAEPGTDPEAYANRCLFATFGLWLINENTEAWSGDEEIGLESLMGRLQKPGLN